MMQFFKYSNLNHCSLISLAMLCVPIDASFAIAEDHLATATMTYAEPQPILCNGQSIQLDGHAAVRCYDWDGDGDLDVLAGDGAGRIWWFENRGTENQPMLAEKQVVAAGEISQWGQRHTGVAFAQILGSDLPDLIIGHSKRLISIHENIGSAQSPVFEESGTTIEVQDGCDGRFDVVDWDSDGSLDLVTGSFDGTVQWHRNTSSKHEVTFTAGEPFCDIRIAYNAHPRLIDFDGNQQVDLLLGLNWGSVTLYRQVTEVSGASLDSGQQLKWTDGKNLNIRSLNGDDTTPELVDWDGDGVLDLLSGGNNGQLFWMKGIGFPSRVARIKELLKQYGADLGEQLRANDFLRGDVFGCLQAIQADLGTNLIGSAAREELFASLAPLAKVYAESFSRQHFDLNREPHLPLLAAQYWVVLLESLPNTKANRERVANALGFEGGYRTLLVDFGVIFVDNQTATAEHLDAMIRLLRHIPASTWDVETITVAGWLGPALQTHPLRSRSGINIFDLPLGRPENSFASDSPRPGVTDVYLICLAHEIAHNMLDTVGKKNRPDLYELKFLGLAQAAGPHVVFQSPPSKGIDLESTQANFLRIGAWNGEKNRWREAWLDYFKGNPEFDRAYSRGNIQFFLDSPQEAFATLANQYYADSGLMLEFCKKRWNEGNRTNINQFLLIAEYLSEGKGKGGFFQLKPGGKLSVESVVFQRDTRSRIAQLKSNHLVARFRYDSAGLVTSFDLTNRVNDEK
ncbi:VCBS repeat-containing protein [Rubripirellula sp.]|nr:VCBS repeat-containing protein [Rubripirellula sp.]